MTKCKRCGIGLTSSNDFWVHKVGLREYNYCKKCVEIKKKKR